jgi:hypothetical protein
MKSALHKSLLYHLSAIAVSFFPTCQALGVILHPDSEPNLATCMDRPDANVVGRWSSNASFVVIAPNWIITTRHQKTFPATVNIAQVPYACHYRTEWAGGPSGQADIQLVRLTTVDGRNPQLPHYASPHIDANEPGRQMVIGGWGDGRGDPLQTDGITYGYEWDTSGTRMLRLGTNRIDSASYDSSAGEFTSDILAADFDGMNEGRSTVYECTPADHDSGGGWFIYDSNEWKLAALSRAVTVHYEEGHDGDPNYVLYQSWFRSRDDPLIHRPDYFEAVRISSYATWILDTISVQVDLNADDWVDFADYSLLVNNWLDGNCADSNDCNGADLDLSGSVDMVDLQIFSRHWLEGSG